jgi:hypothetical protein
VLLLCYREEAGDESDRPPFLRHPSAGNCPWLLLPVLFSRGQVLLPVLLSLSILFLDFFFFYLLFLFSIDIMRFIHVVPFIVKAWIDSFQGLFCNACIHFIVDGYLVCFHFKAVNNHIAMNKHINIFW